VTAGGVAAQAAAPGAEARSLADIVASFDPAHERRNVRLISVVALMTNGNDGEPVVDALLDALAEHYRWPGRAMWP
jgi:hypothetical protein